MTEYLACLILGVVLGVVLSRTGHSEHERQLRATMEHVLAELESLREAALEIWSPHTSITKTTKTDTAVERSKYDR
jgi:uncharacterized membrane-anchored protein YhcB (DUF1043 family)